MKKVVIVVIMFVDLLILSYSFNIKGIKNFYLEQKSRFIVQPFSFIVNKKGEIYLLDRKDGNIKIFNNKGKLIKVFGRKGVGPNEFLNPVVLAKQGDKIIVYDFKRRFLFLFSMDNFNNMKFVKKIEFGGLSLNIHFIDEAILLISGMDFSKENEKYRKSYNLYTFNINSKKYDYLLSSAKCFGVKNQKEVDKIFINKINYLSVDSYADFSKRYFYYIHSTDLKIIRLGRNNGKIDIFGKQTRKYIKPNISVELKKAIRMRKHNKVNEIEKKMSFILSLFYMDKSKVMVLFTSYNYINNKQDIYMQLYDVNGKFIKESLLLNTQSEYKNDLRVYYNRKTKSLYILETVSSGSSDLKFRIHKFKITDK